VENDVEFEKLYGDGIVIGKEIDDMMLEVAKQDISKKQLVSQRNTFLQFVKDRKQSQTPARDFSPSNNLDSNRQDYQLNLKQSERNGSLPKLARDVSEYSSFMTSQ
jgi:hypothetical protein